MKAQHALSLVRPGEGMLGCMRVLAVDDDKLVRMNLSLMLGREGYAVDTASTCHEARELLGANVYGVVLTDLDLPDASGLEVLRTARALAPATKVIVVTGSGSFAPPPGSEFDGAEAILLKPFALGDVLLEVRRALGWTPREGEV
jgi:two-component system response regulator PilR (NtrC family)